MKQHSEKLCKISVSLKFKGQNRELWFITESSNSEYFCTDRCDGIIVMLLPELLLIGEDINSELAISEKLYYNLEHLNRFLVKQSKGRFQNIKINCPLTSKRYEDAGRKNATGMSFGIDSMYSFYSHAVTPPHSINCTTYVSGNPESACSVESTEAQIPKVAEGCILVSEGQVYSRKIPSDFVVNLICFFNHGSLNSSYTNNQEQMRAIYNKGREKVVKFAQANNISYLNVDTNIDEFYSLNYTKTNTFRTVGIAVCFQKLIKNYYYSSGYDLGEIFKSDPYQDSAYYDILSLPSLGTENINLFSDGYEVSRYEKTEYLTKYKDTRKYLNVCWQDLENCSSCPKCIRTMAALELLGQLEEYKNVFSLEKYFHSYNWNWAKIISLRKTDSFYKEIYDLALRKNKKFGAKIKILALLFSIGRFAFKPRLLSAVQRCLKRLAIRKN